MDLGIEELRKKLKEAGLKITPQRIAILEAVYKLENHPTADNIIDFIRKNHPGVATGTVYNVLDTLLGENLIKRVKTEKDAMRYEGFIKKHHHLYCAETDKIEDYFDDELDQLLKSHFEQKGITNFEIKDIILQIKGDFK